MMVCEWSEFTEATHRRRALQTYCQSAKRRRRPVP